MKNSMCWLVNVMKFTLDLIDRISAMHIKWYKKFTQHVFDLAPFIFPGRIKKMNIGFVEKSKWTPGFFHCLMFQIRLKELRGKTNFLNVFSIQHHLLLNGYWGKFEYRLYRAIETNSCSIQCMFQFFITMFTATCLRRFVQFVKLFFHNNSSIFLVNIFKKYFK